MKILHVEDNPGDAKLVRYAFEEAAPHIEIDWVSTCGDALERLARCEPEDCGYDLVLTDMQLPDGNGLSLIPALQESGIQIPLVVVTGRDDTETALSALKAGASDYVVKTDRYLKDLPGVLAAALERYKSEMARHAKPLHVLYAARDSQEAESARAHFALYAPFIHLDYLHNAEALLEKFSSQGFNREIRKSDHGYPCDAILLDDQFPGMLSLSLLKELRSIRRVDVPIIFMSGEDIHETALHALRLGADDYIVKSTGYLYRLPIVLENAFNRVQVERDQKALKDREEYFRLLTENAPDMIAVADLSGVLRYYSPSVVRNFGYRKDEFINMDISAKVHPDDIALVMDKFNEIIRNPDLIVGPVEIRILHSNGAWRWVEAVGKSAQDSSGQRIAIINARDITERKEMETDLAESENQYRSLVENSLAGVFIIQDRLIRFVNERFCEITGYTVAELVDHIDIMNLIHYDYWQVIEEGIQNLRTDKKAFEQDVRMLGKGNRLSHVKTFISPITFRGKLAAAGICIDITHEKTLEGQLRQAQKMEAIGTLAGGIAHDFNNILGVMLGYSELACEMVSDRPEALSMVKSAMKAIYRAKDLVQQILTFSRHTETEKMPIKVIPLVKETVQFLRASLPTTIQIETKINAKEDTVIADPTKIHQVLINLSTNAAHAMKDHGGNLTITVDNVHVQVGIQNPDQAPKADHYLQLTVADTGQGISNCDLERIFEPYFTTKKAAEGTGLGLAVVHGIVKEHDGHIKVYSEEGKGATFQVLLPLSEVSARTRTDTMSSNIAKGHGRILFVDDEELLAKVGKQLLERLGYDVKSYTDPAKALDVFIQDPQFFDCVITDRTMPLITGFDVAHEIHQVRSDIPIILCSGFLEKDDTTKAADMGITKIILKPFDTFILADTIQSVLDKKVK